MALLCDESKLGQLEFSRHILPNLLFILSLSICGPIQADISKKEAYQHELDDLYKSIQTVQQHLKSTRYQRSNVLTELKDLEDRISKNSLTLKTLAAEIRKLDEDINEIRQTIKKLNLRVDQQRKVLEKQIRAAYSFGTQQQIKMMLNQQDPASMGRVAVYFDYLNRARSEEIRRFIETINQRRIARQQLEDNIRRQRAAHDEQQENKRLLSKQRFKRNRLLAQIELEIKDQEQNLQALEQSRTQIENLLNSLGELLADIPPSPTDSTPFSSLKGQLPWPVAGPFLAHYGTQRRGDLRWNGVLIGADYGEPIRAVSHGRIAFSDWLQGFGFITIINHDEGYMTLYGHNESLFKETGDWVNAGDVIASVGDSGGQPRSGLYFEIRERGKPVDPGSWCDVTISHSSVD